MLRGLKGRSVPCSRNWSKEKGVGLRSQAKRGLSPWLPVLRGKLVN